ncbi:PAS domain S-box protein [Marivirga arenosa]|uniref:PAS domain S-box protein n=1 Tax=Marivirga arenosa TaxID=3059076 RepID=A0AA51ZXH4_9BACT|nr:PAS domain-containing protein [Marivirga sp. BKB1-2]WNB18588.1 PAS domain S-box protein [Marivirga sp. BKB1-2]
MTNKILNILSILLVGASLVMSFLEIEMRYLILGALSVALIFLIINFFTFVRVSKIIKKWSGDFYWLNKVLHQFDKKMKDFQELKANVSYAFAAINNIGEKQFLNEIKNINSEAIKFDLEKAHNKILKLRKTEEENAWINEGIAQIASIKNSDNNISEYSFQILKTVISYLNLNQGQFFIKKTDEEGDYFELSATYAFDRRKYFKKKIRKGQGLLGQLFYDKELLYFTEIPEDYIQIKSGLGDALPRSICLIPFISDDKIYGAMEVASFQNLDKNDFEYLEKIAARIGFNLTSISNQANTERMLKESQELTQEMRAQEEELRQNMEELEATQNQMNSKQKEINAVLSALSTVELDLDGRVNSANEVFMSITGYKDEQIVGKPYRNLIPQHGNDPIQYEIMWNSILEGRTFSGEFRIVNAEGNEIWMAGNFTPILNENNEPYKVMVISLFTTQDKEKLIEFQEIVAVFKNCFPIAEVYPDFRFKTANDLFLKELGIKRLELRKTLLSDFIKNGVHDKVKKQLEAEKTSPENIELLLELQDGNKKSFNSSIQKIGVNDKERALLILQRSN